MKKSKLVRVGGEAYKTSENCTMCGRCFTKVPFGHHFKTSRGSLDLCRLCAEELYTVIVVDLVGGIFALHKDIEDIRRSLTENGKYLDSQ